MGMNANMTRGKPELPCGAIYTELISPTAGVFAGKSIRSSQDPSWDHHLMEAFLEFEQAIGRRSVRIYPYALGSAIVMSPELNLWELVRGYYKARGEARKNRGRIGWRLWMDATK